MRSTARTRYTSPHANEPAVARTPVFQNQGPREPNRPDIRRAPRRAVKRAIDVVGASILLVLLAPVLGVIALLVRLDGGAALFRHERIGRWGRPFGCYKYRTMVVDAEALLPKLFARDPSAREEWQATQKLKDDPRVTPIGRWLRRTSLDELPQLLNVLRGEMSLVGPRPIVRDELVRYGTEAWHYLRERPGLTGLWQVSGRNDLTYEDRVRLDGFYLRNISVVGDLRILFRTCWIVIRGRGAH